MRGIDFSSWQGVLSISELIPAYASRHGEVQREAVLHFMVRDESNSSSIASCLRAAPVACASGASSP